MSLFFWLSGPVQITCINFPGFLQNNDYRTFGFFFAFDVNLLLTPCDSFCYTYVRSSRRAHISGNNSVVECNLAKVDVASSNLVSRSKKSRDQANCLVSFFSQKLPLNQNVSIRKPNLTPWCRWEVWFVALPFTNSTPFCRYNGQIIWTTCRCLFPEWIFDYTLVR